MAKKPLQVVRRQQPSSKPKSRVRISDQHVAEICNLILEWRGKITWDHIVKEAERRCGQQWTRQGLYNHEDIKAAYKKKGRSGKKGKDRPEQLEGDFASDYLDEKLDRQELEIRRLELLVNSYLELFIRYQVNAHARGISPAELEAPLIPVARRSRS